MSSEYYDAPQPLSSPEIKAEITKETSSPLTLERIFPEAEGMALVQQILAAHPTIPHLKEKFLAYLQTNPQAREKIYAVKDSPTDYQDRIMHYIEECIANETLPTFQPSSTEQKKQEQIQEKLQQGQENQQQGQEKQQKIEENRTFYEKFKALQEQEFAQHPELKTAVIADPVYQRNKELLSHPATLQQLQARGISEEMVESYLLGQATFDLAQQQGIALSPKYTSAFKSFEQSLDLPEGIFSFQKIEISADIRTHTPNTLIKELSTDTRALFDPDTGSKALGKGYDKSRERHSSIYKMVEKKLDNEELVQKYGAPAQQQKFQEVMSLLEELNKTQRSPTKEEQEQFKQWSEIKAQLLQKQHDYEETIKLAMGRSFISGQAIQHLKRLNSSTGNTFNFNPANAFDLQGDLLTTTVYNAGDQHPFKIRTDTSQPGKIQISNYLQKINNDIYIDNNSFQEISCPTPGEKELFASMLVAYDKAAENLTGKMSLEETFATMQTVFQDAIAQLYTNTDLVQQRIKKHIEKNHTSQLWIDNWRATTRMPEGKFATQMHFNEDNGTPKETLQCLQRATEIIPYLSFEQAQMIKECSAFVYKKSKTTQNGHNFSEFGQFFFNENSFNDPNNLAILRNLVLGEKGEKPLIRQLKAMLDANEKPEQQGNINAYRQLHQRFLEYKDKEYAKEVLDGIMDPENATVSPLSPSLRPR